MLAGANPARKPVTVVVLHSMFGLRPAEHAAAARLRAAGHRVALPDLFDGAVAGDGGLPVPEDGFHLMEAIGWETIVTRARAAMRDLPADTVLCGLSMGAGVVGAIWPERLDAAAAILMHAPAIVPGGVRPGTPVALYTYPGAGHFFTDAELPDHDRSAADEAWRRVGALLRTVR